MEVLPAPIPGTMGCAEEENNLTAAAAGAWRVLLLIRNCLFRLRAIRRIASKLLDILCNTIRVKTRANTTRI